MILPITSIKIFGITTGRHRPYHGYFCCTKHHRRQHHPHCNHQRLHVHNMCYPQQ